MGKFFALGFVVVFLVVGIYVSVHINVIELVFNAIVQVVNALPKGWSKGAYAPDQVDFVTHCCDINTVD